MRRPEPAVTGLVVYAFLVESRVTTMVTIYSDTDESARTPTRRPCAPLKPLPH